MSLALPLANTPHMGYTESSQIEYGVICLQNHPDWEMRHLTEQFVSAIIRERFDYTRWQREYFDRKTKDEISSEAEAYERANPYQGSAIRI